MFLFSARWLPDGMTQSSPIHTEHFNGNSIARFYDPPERTADGVLCTRETICAITNSVAIRFVDIDEYYNCKTLFYSIIGSFCSALDVWIFVGQHFSPWAAVLEFTDLTSASSVTLLNSSAERIFKSNPVIIKVNLLQKNANLYNFINCHELRHVYVNWDKIYIFLAWFEDF